MSHLPPLPATLRTIAEATSVDVALDLALKAGGRRLRVPEKAEGTDLAELVGIDAARAIVDVLANERIEVPHGRRWLYPWLRKRGWSQERCAHALKIARRTAQAWDQACADAVNQLDLWPS